MDADILRTADPRNLGRRLQEARRARGLTQQDVAEHLGVARTTVTAIEKGERRVQSAELVQLASLYGRSIGEFLRDGEPTDGFAVQLRSTFAPETNVDSEIAPHAWEFQRLCEDYVELERLCNAPLRRRYPPQYQIDRTTPEAAAEDVAVAERNRLGLGDGPLLNLREVLETDVGLRIFYMELPSRVAAMFAYAQPFGGCIAANRKHPEERRRMSISHDYGHFLTNRYRPEVALLGHFHRQPEHERFAEAFAHAFLMPAMGLSRRFHELRRSRNGQITPADLLNLAHLYFVSLEALMLRLEDLGLLTGGTWERLQRAGFRVREAQQILGLPQHPVSDGSLPVRYQYLAAVAYQRGQVSEGQLARFLRVDRLEARRIAEALTGSAIVSEDGTVETVELDLGTTLTGRSA